MPLGSSKSSVDRNAIDGDSASRASRFFQHHSVHSPTHTGLSSVLRARIGRAVYYMLKRREPFNLTRFFGETLSSKTATRITGSSSLSSGSPATPPDGEPHANDRIAGEVVSAGSVQNLTTLASLPTRSDARGRPKHRPISTAPRRGSTTPARRLGGR